MLRKESVQKRLESESGLSLLEFMYSVLQAFDYWMLFKSHNCVLQIGGSDQLGNIQSGTELIDKIITHEYEDISNESKKLHSQIGCHALTTNLLVNSKGEKFGKSNGDVVWVDPLDEEVLLKLHQYLINQHDDMISSLLMQFTFLSEEEISNILSIHSTNPENKYGQLKISETILQQITNNDEYVTKILNYSNYFKLNFDEFLKLNKNEIENYFDSMIRVFKINKSDLNTNFIDLIFENGQTGLTRKEIKKIIQNGLLQINNTNVNLKMNLNNVSAISDQYYLFRLTKKIYFTFKLE